MDKRHRYYHYEIGKQFWRALTLEELERFVAIVVSQLLKGKELMSSQLERNAVAKLCLLAGEKAVSQSNFQAALRYIESGIDLLDKKSCWEEEYDLCLNLYSAAAECSFSSGKAGTVENYASIIKDHACCSFDTIRVQIIHLSVIGSMGDYESAKQLGTSLLRELGQRIPARPTFSLTFLTSVRLAKRVAKMTDKKLLNLPVMSDAKKLAAMQVLNITLLHAFISNELHGAVLLNRAVDLTLNHGVSGLSCTALVHLGEFMCFTGYIDEGYKVGELAMLLRDKFQNRSFYARIAAAFYFNIYCYKHSFRECVDPLIKGHDVGMETGDVEFAIICAIEAAFYKFEYYNLAAQDESLRLLQDRSRELKQLGSLEFLKPVWQCGLNLMGQATDDPLDLTGEVFQEETIFAWRERHPSIYVFSFFSRVLLRYLLGSHVKAAELAIACLNDKSIGFSINVAFYAMIHFFHGMSLLSVARTSKKRFDVRVLYSLQFLRRMSDYQHDNFLGKYLMLKAEMCSVGFASYRRKLSKYKLAIMATKSSRSLLDYALAHEVTAKFIVRGGKEVGSATPYFLKSLQIYEEWGAVIKVEQLRGEMKLYGIEKSCGFCEDFCRSC